MPSESPGPRGRVVADGEKCRRPGPQSLPHFLKNGVHVNWAPTTSAAVRFVELQWSSCIGTSNQSDAHLRGPGEDHVFWSRPDRRRHPPHQIRRFRWHTRLHVPGTSAGQPTDRRTDIWSIGVLVHEMLTGRLPFAGDREQALSIGIVHSTPEPVTALRGGLPLELDRVLAKHWPSLPNNAIRTSRTCWWICGRRAVGRKP